MRATQSWVSNHRRSQIRHERCVPRALERSWTWTEGCGSLIRRNKASFHLDTIHFMHSDFSSVKQSWGRCKSSLCSWFSPCPVFILLFLSSCIDLKKRKPLQCHHDFQSPSIILKKRFSTLSHTNGQYDPRGGDVREMWIYQRLGELSSLMSGPFRQEGISSSIPLLKKKSFRTIKTGLLLWDVGGKPKFLH